MRGIVEGRFLTLIGVAATILLLLNLAYLNSHGGVEDCDLLGISRKQVVEVDTRLQLPLLSTEPKESFRENLRNDTKYITTLPSNGWTNDVMAFCNMIYLALLTKRIPILARFAPTHVGNAAGFIPFSEIFDLPRMSKAIGIPMVEWGQLKNLTSEPLEDIGCWDTHTTLFKGGVLHSVSEERYGLDISYTPIPESARIAHDSKEIKANFMAVAALTYPETRKQAIARPPYPVIPSRTHHHTLPPDEQVECYDYTYDFGAAEPWEWEFEWAPAWKEVGRHAYFTSGLVDIAEGMVRRAFKLEGNEPLPPMITVHIRRNDFRKWCQDVGVPEDECLAPLSVYAKRLEQVKEELRTQKGVSDIQHVLVSSDEADPEWWKEVQELGWYWIDHDAEQTEEKYGKWYPVFIDVCAQAFGKGFVGTARSTLSLVSAKRVVDWNDGVYRRVGWGHKGEDDHYDGH